MDLLFDDLMIFNVPNVNKKTCNATGQEGLCIVVNSVEYGAHQVLLEKIIKATGKNMSQDVLLITPEENQIINLTEQIPTHVQQVICFGVSPKSLGLNAAFRANQNYKTETYSIVLTYGLSELHDNVTKKKALWSTLQKL